MASRRWGRKFGAGEEVWRWGAEVWRWGGSLALGRKFGAGRGNIGMDDMLDSRVTGMIVSGTSRSTSVTC